VAAVIILSLMIFPLITLNLLTHFELASHHLKKISESLGLSTSTYIWSILLPSVKSPMVGGIFISFGRAIGETMAVMMVCGNIVQVPKHFFAPIRTLTGNIALEMSYAVGPHRSALFLSGFLLLLIVAIIFLISDKFFPATLKKRPIWKD